jgi:transcriptional regulator with XRE-family HTH domain
VSYWTSDTVYGIKLPAELVKELRAENGLTQRELAYRAGTSQAAIARIESGAEDLTWTRLRSILAAMGEEPLLGRKRLASRYDFDDLMLDRAMSPEARLANGLSLSRFGSEVALAGAAARARHDRA